MDTRKLDKIIEQYSNVPGQVLLTLEAVQEEEGYVPKEAMCYISQKTGVPLSQLFSVCTFYAAFSLKPRGKHIITVCEGTSCHVRGGPRLREALLDLLRIPSAERHEKSITTADRLFTLETTRCLGCCSLAPVMMVDGNIYGYLTPKKLPDVLKNYEWEAP
ncbi:MAG: NAD(P)H-dependent oxidoreductase subunit E [Desulfobacterota bacterium]|nr:NAD(P)H-dependent oxidoreductase subunit E [Thermodesulfobacteriota bacterium]